MSLWAPIRSGSSSAAPLAGPGQLPVGVEGAHFLPARVMAQLPANRSQGRAGGAGQQQGVDLQRASSRAHLPIFLQPFNFWKLGELDPSNCPGGNLLTFLLRPSAFRSPCSLQDWRGSVSCPRVSPCPLTCLRQWQTAGSGTSGLLTLHTDPALDTRRGLCRAQPT